MNDMNFRTFFQALRGHGLLSTSKTCQVQSVYWGLSMSMPKDGSLPELRPISHLEKDVWEVAANPAAKHYGSKVDIIQAFVLPLFWTWPGKMNEQQRLKEHNQASANTHAMWVDLSLSLGQHVFFPSAHLKGVCFQHKILMPVELATKTPKRTSKQMTSNSPCTSIALGFGNPANSAEVGVRVFRPPHTLSEHDQHMIELVDL